MYEASAGAPCTVLDVNGAVSAAVPKINAIGVIGFTGVSPRFTGFVDARRRFVMSAIRRARESNTVC